MYRGTVARIGGKTPTVLSSIRLETSRDGFEDFEYLHAYAKLFGRERALAVLRLFVENAHTFSEEPARLLAARKALAVDLHEAAIRGLNGR